MTETISIKLGKTMKEELRALAESDRRTLSSYIALVLEDFLKQQRAEHAGKPKRGGK